MRAKIRDEVRRQLREELRQETRQRRRRLQRALEELGLAADLELLRELCASLPEAEMEDMAAPDLPGCALGAFGGRLPLDDLWGTLAIRRSALAITRWESESTKLTRIVAEHRASSKVSTGEPGPPKRCPNVVGTLLRQPRFGPIPTKSGCALAFRGPTLPKLGSTLPSIRPFRGPPLIDSGQS